MSWIQTFTGKKIYPLEPASKDIRLEDIAHALALTCRFGGHCREFYSVAQHSVLVSRYCAPEDAAWGLMHDAAEAYLVDLPNPIKRGLREAGVHAFDQIEAQLLEAICIRFVLPMEMPASVKAADLLLLATEARDLMGQGADQWTTFVTPLPERVVPVGWREAEQLFITRCREVGLFSFLQEGDRRCLTVG